MTLIAKCYPFNFEDHALINHAQ